MKDSEKINLKDTVIYEYLHSSFNDKSSEEIYFMLHLHLKILYSSLLIFVSINIEPNK
jgi:hypothetical protein